MTTEIAAAASTLTPEQAELQARARALRRGGADPARGRGRARAAGACPPSGSPRSGARRSTRRLGGGLHARRARRPGLDATPSGSSSRSSSAARPTRCPGTCRRAYNVLAHGTPEQIDRYLQARRCAASCTTPTRSPRSTPARTRRGIATTATRDRRRLARSTARSGSSPTATSPRVYIVMAKALVDGERAADAVPRRARRAGHRGRRRPAVHAHLPARPPDAPLHRRRGRATTR